MALSYQDKKKLMYSLTVTKKTIRLQVHLVKREIIQCNAFYFHILKWRDFAVPSMASHAKMLLLVCKGNRQLVTIRIHYQEVPIPTHIIAVPYNIILQYIAFPQTLVATEEINYQLYKCTF